MTRYTHADFTDNDSVNSVQLTEGISSSATHIRYYAGTSIWRQRSMLEKVLLVLVATLFFVMVVLSIILHSAEHRIHESRLIHIEDKSSEPCLNASCVHLAGAILSAMNTTMDPCTDFYSYSCDGWIASNPLPDGKSTWGTFMKLEQQNQAVIKRALERPFDTFKTKAEQKAKWYYESCLDGNDTMEELGATPMIDVMKKMGGWNITDTGFKVKGWDLQKVLEVVQNKYYLGALFAYTVGEDDKNSSRYILQIDQSGLILPTRDYYLNETEHGKVLEAYLDYMTRVGVLLGGEVNTTKEQMKAVIQFEKRLANITTPSEERRDEEAMYHLFTIEELKQKAPFLEWRAFFENAMKIVNHKVSSKEKIVVYAPEYLGNLSLLIKEYQSTIEGNITLNNYVVWHTVRAFSGCLSRAFRDAYRGLRKALVGNEGGEEAQWRYCVQDTTNVLGFAIGAIFVREVFHQDSKTQAEEMINNVRNAFKANFAKLKWMDEQTRKAAIIKTDAMSDMIGYPEFIRDPRQLDDRYDDLVIRNDTYFLNNLNINLYNLKKTLEKIKQPVNKTTWNMPPSTVNAYYTPSKNQMVFPAGILQSPFYDPNFPDSLNYGGMGVVVGHELTHGFDDQGREFDKDGNLKQWWGNKTIDAFKNRTKCVVEQYDKFKIENKNVNGNKTLGENIADNGGLKAAYHAYLKLMKGKTPPSRLPGLPLDHRQLFFVAFAQVWCTTVTKESVSLQLDRDPHSPPKYRVIGALSNLEEFSLAFRCPPGSPMNPKKKCEVW